ncbi:hypothetical protein RKE38_10435 [Phycicoccus sp. M110.8]|uniref:hypothetical protein n=1 Tax=Phycicoccus sp. M110.8 TaxID=3075433 RepID=UPI0028FD4B64|nr:hypothetical protein [Phycicoccus sp. M110.8]MDU0314102.1 hypothetical protein [Phycicoccus sp. M110.8]
MRRTMNHYRLLPSPELPIPMAALAVPSSDLASVGGPAPLGMAAWDSLLSGRVEVPSIRLVADMHFDKSVALFDGPKGPYPTPMVRYDFPDEHGAWATRVHHDSGLLLLASMRDLAEYSSGVEFGSETWVGLMSLAVRATMHGAGTGPRPSN